MHEVLKYTHTHTHKHLQDSVFYYQVGFGNLVFGYVKDSLGISFGCVRYDVW